jgi:hypothetical protein
MTEEEIRAATDAALKTRAKLVRLNADVLYQRHRDLPEHKTERSLKREGNCRRELLNLNLELERRGLEPER